MKIRVEICEEPIVEFESVDQLEQWLERERERERIQRQEFKDHLNHASAVVATWPEWERRILG